MIDVSQLLPKLVTASCGNEVLLETAVTLAWTRVAGEGLRTQVAPFRLYRRTLIVAVRDVIWQKQLHQMSSEFVARINRVLGATVVDAIEFRIDPNTVNARDVAMPKGGRGRHQEIPREVTDAASRIEDPDLRKLFVRAAGNCISRRDATVKGGFAPHDFKD